MKAILRSINNFSCKLKQSNNLKYNISPKIRSNKFKSISGNGNIVIEDALDKNLKNYRIDGNTYQNSTSGINEWNSFNKEQTDTYKVLEDGTIQLINSSNSSNGYTRTSKTLKEMCPGLNVGDTVYLYIESTWYRKEIYSSSLGASNAWQNGQSRTLTQQMLDDYLILYGGYQTTSTIKIMITKNQYYDTYEPYTGGQPSPNPDYLQEIVSCGDKTKNMITGLRNSTSNFINFYFDKDMAVNNMTVSGIFTYTISNFTIFLQTSFGNESLLTNQSCTQNKKFSFDIQLTDSQLENIVNSTITPSIQFYRTGAMSEIGYSEIMLRASDTTAEYEPYGKYKIPVNVKSDNLFDKSTTNKLNGYFEYTNDTIHSSNSNRVIYIPCKPNTTYSFTKTISTLSNRVFQIATTNNIPTIGETVYDYTDHRNDTTFTYTTNSTAKYLVIRIRKDDDADNFLSAIQIVEGSIVPDKYIPYYNETTNIYLDEPLRKIDKYSDYIDFVNNKIVRKIRKIILDGSENWARSYGNNLFNIQHFLDDDMFIVGYGLSNYYRYNPIQSGINANTKNGEFALQSSYGGNIMIKNTDYTVINDFKAWLSTHNTEILYPLETPIEEDIELPNINLIEGKNIITIGTELESIIEVEYYSKEIIDISDYKYNLRKVED